MYNNSTNSNRMERKQIFVLSLDSDKRARILPFAQSAHVLKYEVTIGRSWGNFITDLEVWSSDVGKSSKSQRNNQSHVEVSLRMVRQRTVEFVQRWFRLLLQQANCSQAQSVKDSIVLVFWENTIIIVEFGSTTPGRKTNELLQPTG